MLCLTSNFVRQKGLKVERKIAVFFKLLTFGLNLGWEFDFWGRFSHKVKSASAELDASVATSFAKVYRALGGGCEIRNDRDTVELLPAAMKDEMRERTEAWDGVLK